MALTNHHLAAIVLAAGKGTRLNSKDINKVMRPLAGKPMIAYTTELLDDLEVEQTVVVVGFKKESIIEFLGPDYTFVEQVEQLGTGDAIKVALPQIDPNIEHVLIIQGDDSAFYPPQLIHDLVTKHIQRDADLTFVTAHKDNPHGLGRIIRDTAGSVVAIREEKNCTPQERSIHEVNTACYLAKKEFLLTTVPQITPTPPKNEYYLTDIISLGLKAGRNIETLTLDHDNYNVGVNTREELERADKKMRQLLQASD